MAYDTAAPGDAPDRTPDRCGHAPEDGDAAGPATSNEVMCALDDVVITQELARRPSRPPDHEAENRALTALAQALASDPGSVLQQVVETAKALCRADTAGVSILEPGGEHGIFRWHAIAGPLAYNMMGAVPGEDSPCGVVTARNEVLLFTQVERYFAAARDVQPRIHESLLAPWSLDGEPVGTLWLIAHTPEHRFDAEDARLLQSLARFASAAWQTSRALAAAAAARDELEQRVEERTVALRDSEARYRTLFESIDEGFCVVEVLFDGGGRAFDYRFLETNPAFVGQTGLAEAVGKTILELAPLHEPFWFDIYGEIARTGQARRFEHEARALNRWYDVYAFRIGRPQEARVALLFNDISQRRIAEQALRESETRFRAFVTASSEIVYRMGPDWSQMRELDGQGFLPDTSESSETWMGRYIHPDDQPAVQAAIERAVLAKTMFELEHPVRRVDGSLGWALSRAIPILDDRAEIVEWLGAASDVTPRKQAEAALREADRRKDEFLATLAHELRNPLAPIHSALQLLRSNGAGIDTAALHATIERQVGHMVRLVDDLLDVSRISRGVIELKSEPLDLREVLHTAVETSRPAIERGHHALALDLPGEPLAIEGDAVRLAQVFTNVLNNAAKYTDDGGRIEFAARRDGEDAVVTVRDNGIGIAPEQLSRVFEMFGQRHGGQARPHGGLGIGLHLAQRLMQLHGGSVQAASDGAGQGSTFTVRLPLAVHDVPAPLAPAMRTDAAPDLKAQRILIVDDNRDAAETLALLLGTLGGETKVETDGASALTLLQRWRPAVVLLDLGMPGMDGYEVARRIRADPSLDGVLLVALTGWGQAADRQRTREAGFDHHLTKPVALDALLAVLPGAATSRNAKA